MADAFARQLLAEVEAESLDSVSQLMSLRLLQCKYQTYVYLPPFPSVSFRHDYTTDLISCSSHSPTKRRRSTRSTPASQNSMP